MRFDQHAAINKKVPDAAVKERRFCDQRRFLLLFFQTRSLSKEAGNGKNNG